MTASAPAPAPAAPPARRRARPAVLAYFTAIIAAAVVAALAAALYSWSAARQEARALALGDASFAAELGAAAIASDLEALTGTVATTGANPALHQVFDAPAGSCSFTFAGGRVFLAGHISVVAADGSVPCSSLAPLPEGEPYAGAAWLPEALAGPLTTGPTADPALGADVVLTAVPISERGVLAGAFDVASVGQGLVERFGGPRQLELLVVAPDGATVLSRSVDPDSWHGAALAGTPFDAGDDDGGEGRDVEGAARFYGQAEVEGLGWTVLAGADQSSAYAAATRSFQRTMAIVAVGLLVTLALVVVAYRGVSRPVRQLSRQVRTAVEGRGFSPVTTGGAREVMALNDDFAEVFAAMNRELAERERAEEEARAAERNYRVLFDGNPQPMWVYDEATRALLEVNDAAVASYGYGRDELLRMSADDVQLGGGTATAAEPGEVHREQHIRQDGATVEADVVSHAVRFAGRDARLVLAQDVTERDRLQRQLAQAQRLESLGKLAGGVAHDFNNLLTVMLTCATFIRDAAEEAPGEDTRWAGVADDARQVLGAVDRATALTRQLLAFARREVVEPQVVDVGDVVGELERLLSRSIGAQIDLRTNLAPELWRTKIDPGQLEQALVNLAVNARDAMPHGGTLAIDAENIDVDVDYAVGHHGVAPGRYLRVRVSDTGAGMSRETLERAFEPFFTTKEVGRGTGLGLATVYGIVAQAGGHVQLYSEVGLGTTVSLLLPATEEEPAEPVAAAAPAVRGGGETVLVVEDQAELREVTERILVGAGYQVLTAPDGRAAVHLAASYDAPIDLLITDVVMPNGLSGSETATVLKAAREDLAVLFVSGYAEPVLAANSDVGLASPLLEKPFTAASLLAKARDTLDTNLAARRA